MSRITTARPLLPVRAVLFTRDGIVASGPPGPPGDVTPPVLSTPGVSAITSTSAHVAFTTDELATSEVRHSTAVGMTSPTTVVASVLPSTSHAADVTGLTPGTTYYVQARATDALLNVSAWGPVTPVSFDATPESNDLVGMAIGTVTLTRTFQNVGVEVSFTGDDDADATAVLEFKRTADGSWRPALPMSRCSNGTFGDHRCFLGGALGLASGTAYDVRVTVSDGESNSQVVTGAITTMTDNIAAHAALVAAANRWVSTTGSDSAAGTSVGAPWLTPARAISLWVTAAALAQTNWVVLCEPGYYPYPTTAITENSTGSTLTFVARSAAVNDSRAIINAGTHSILEPRKTASPTGSGGANAAPWTTVTLTGPNLGGSHQAWKWTGGATFTPVDVFMATARDSAVWYRVVNWSLSNTPIADSDGHTWSLSQTGAAAAVLETICTNDTYRYGLWRNGADLFIRIQPYTVGGTPQSTNPNDYWWTLASTDSITVYADDVRFSGFEMRSIVIDANAATAARIPKRLVVDHSLMQFGRVRLRGSSAATPNLHGSDHLIQYNRFLDTNQWSLDQANRPSIPRQFIKSPLYLHDVVTSSWTKCGGGAETSAFYGGGGAHTTTIRHNTVIGYFNGINNFNAGYDRYAGKHMDLHDNVFLEIADDVFEPSFDVMLWFLWRNRVRYTPVFLSLGPTGYGPFYAWDNAADGLGSLGVADDLGGRNAASGRVLKYAADHRPPARFFSVNNTFWSNDPEMTGSASSAGSGNASTGYWPNGGYLRNTVIRAAREIWVGFKLTSGLGNYDAWNENYNVLVTENVGGDIMQFHVPGQVSYTTLAAYRAGTGQGANSNFFGGSDRSLTDPTWIDGELRDPEAGDLRRLASGSALVQAGVVVPNFERDGIDYTTAPHVGAPDAVAVVPS